MNKPENTERASHGSSPANMNQHVNLKDALGYGVPILLLSLWNMARGAGELQRVFYFALVALCVFWIHRLVMAGVAYQSVKRIGVIPSTQPPTTKRTLLIDSLKFTLLWLIAIISWQLSGWGHGLSIVNALPMVIDTSRSDYWIVQLTNENKHLYWLVRSAYMLPALAVMAIYYKNLRVFLIGLLILLQGSLYWFAGHVITPIYAARLGEGLTMLLIGIMVLLTARSIKYEWTIPTLDVYLNAMFSTLSSFIWGLIATTLSTPIGSL